MSRNRSAIAFAIVTSALGAPAVVAATESAAATSHRTATGAALARSAAAGATINTRHTKLGTLLVNSRGFTVYAFSRDHGRKDMCVKISGCTSLWPPVRTKGKPRAGRGVKRSLLGTTRIPGGEQVTYAGHPLYTYVADSSPGSTFYVNKFQAGGRWPALRPSGALVK